MEADYSGPYFIHEVIGSTVMLKTMAGKVLKTKHSMSHLKPYNRSNEGQKAGEKLNESEKVIRYAGKAKTPLQTKTEGQNHGKVIQSFSQLSPSPLQSPPAKLSRLHHPAISALNYHLQPSKSMFVCSEPQQLQLKSMEVTWDMVNKF